MNQNWREQAACRGVDTQLFYAQQGKGKTVYKEAHKYCDTCPVLADCFKFVMDTENLSGEGGRHGYFAGMTPLQRKHYQRQRNIYVRAS